MEQLSANFNENVRWFNEVLGVGRSCDLVNRDLVIGGRRARIWVIDGFGGDAILERIGSFWLSISPEAVAGIDRMQAFVDRFVTFLEADVGTDPEEITTNVLLGKTLLLVEGIQGAALIDAKEYPGRSRRTARCCGERTMASSRPWSPIWLCCAAGSGTLI